MKKYNVKSPSANGKSQKGKSDGEIKRFAWKLDAIEDDMMRIEDRIYNLQRRQNKNMALCTGAILGLLLTCMLLQKAIDTHSKILSRMY